MRDVKIPALEDSVLSASLIQDGVELAAALSDLVHKQAQPWAELSAKAIEDALRTFEYLRSTRCASIVTKSRQGNEKLLKLPPGVSHSKQSVSLSFLATFLYSCRLGQVSSFHNICLKRRALLSEMRERGALYLMQNTGMTIWSGMRRLCRSVAESRLLRQAPRRA